METRTHTIGDLLIIDEWGDVTPDQWKAWSKEHQVAPGATEGVASPGDPHTNQRRGRTEDGGDTSRRGEQPHFEPNLTTAKEDPK